MSTESEEKARLDLYGRYNALELVLARLTAEVERVSPGTIERVHQPLKIGRPPVLSWMWTAEMDAEADRNDEAMAVQMMVSSVLAKRAFKALPDGDGALISEK